MIQLSFQPALDPFHAIFRFLRTRALIPAGEERPVDHMRIVDFYLCFPFRIGHIRLRQTDGRFRKLGAQYTSKAPYGEQPSDRDVFARMRPMQLAALDTLASRGFISADRFRYSWVAPTAIEPPTEVQSRIARVNGDEADLMAFLRVLANEYDLSGHAGLKDRSGLMEHRYDAV